tara:strand:- start:23 stop:268 length:246 start_codon:yes stop_codon:yes gene_type:complete
MFLAISKVISFGTESLLGTGKLVDGAEFMIVSDICEEFSLSLSLANFHTKITNELTAAIININDNANTTKSIRVAKLENIN